MKRNLLKSMHVVCAALLSVVMLSCGPRKAEVYVTSGEGDMQFRFAQLGNAELRKVAPSEGNFIQLKPESHRQPVYGFGAAITGSTCYNLLKMSEEDREAILQECFSPEQMAMSFIRISIGASDFSLDEYTCCDKEGIEFFELHEYDKRDLLPILKRILEINPAVRIVGSPWSCPKWMKIHHETGEPFDSWTSGILNPKYYADYAEYFVRWIGEMEAEGIPIYAITVQNEPLNHGNSMSLYMGWEQQRDFIRDHLGPEFEKHDIKAKIWAFDHNYNYDNVPDQQGYPLNIFADSEASKYIAGSAWHNYGGRVSELDRIYKAYPDKEIFFTEASIGTWNYDFSKCLVNDFASIFIGTLNRYGRGVTLWNLILDDKGAPNRPKGCRTCFGAIEISSKTYDYASLDRKSHYYNIAHCSKVILPDAWCVDVEAELPRGVEMSAFVNLDGSLAVVAVNRSKEAQEVVVKGTKREFTLTLPAGSIASARWTE
ncbi:MAG: glucosylceramidase [Alistipes sp.]|nr:glucosylceramidase [Alistipes sp.]MBR6759429.1 glucosylceramidase [Alistipes sp.]